MRKTVGERVTADFDITTGKVRFYSNGGILYEDWVERLYIGRHQIESISVEEGTVFLPPCSSGYDTSTGKNTMYGGLHNVESIDLNGFDTSNVINMKWMFCDCYDLRRLDMSNFNTSSVTDMHGMFHYCQSLTRLDLSGFDTSNVTDMSYMFYHCQSMTNLNLSSFDTTKVAAMEGMFMDCRNLKELDLSSFDISNVKDISSIFVNCQRLTHIRMIPAIGGNAATCDIFKNCSADII